MTILQKAIKEILENSVSVSHAIEQNVILEIDFDKVAKEISEKAVKKTSIIHGVTDRDLQELFNKARNLADLSEDIDPKTNNASDTLEDLVITIGAIEDKTYEHGL